MRYVMSTLESEQEDMMYRVFVTDALSVIGRLDVRYIELRERIFVKGAEETRTSEEIIDSISQKLNKMSEGR